MDAATDMEARRAERVATAKRDQGPRGEQKSRGGHDDAKKQATNNAPRKGDRWNAYNSFVDLISPHLPLSDRAIWHVMFRHARDGVCETTVRTIAQAAAVSRSTAEAGLRRLVASGLVWAIWKSKDRAKASKYGIHPKPSECLPRLLGQAEPSRSQGRIDA